MRNFLNEELQKIFDNDINLSQIEIKLQAGANPNIKTTADDPLIIAAVKNKNIEVVKLLLDYGAKIDSMDVKGRTALYWATNRRGYEDIVILLVSRGSNPLSSKYTRNPLEIAVGKNNKDYVELMLTNAMPLLSQNMCYLTDSIIIAAEKGFEEILFNLLEFINIHNEEVYYFTHRALEVAAEYGHINLVKLILKNQNLKRYYKEYSSPLLLAARKGNLEMVSLLLNSNLFFVNDSYNQETALTNAIYSGNLNLINYLIERKANVNFRNWEGKTPLILAIEQKNVETVKTLLKNSANPYLSFFDKYNNSLDALMFAAYKHDEEIMKILLETGMSPNLKNEDGNSAVFLSITDRHWCTMASEIIEDYYDIDGNYKRIIEMFLEHGLDVNITDGYNNNLARWALSRKYKKVLQLLVLEGFNMDFLDDKEQTNLLRLIEQI